MDFFAGGFAVAGLIAATGPILIHLLNRRRFRVVDWAAMDFLREALRRSRRTLEMRDLLLLMLRIACVVLFGLALARPFFSQANQARSTYYALLVLGAAGALGVAAWAALASRLRQRIVAGCVGLGALAITGFGAWGVYGLAASESGEQAAANGRQPVHAIMIVDNSLSMSYTTLEATLLDEAKARVRSFIDDLPRGSRVSILPLCGPRSEFTTEPYAVKDDARDALKAIEIVDRRAGLNAAVALALESARKSPDLPTKRIVLIGDQQALNWSGSLEALRDLPELQVVQVSAKNPDNTWVADVRLRDDVADVETPATLLATVQYQGDLPRPDVQVTLEVDGVAVASRTVDLQPGQARDVEFTHKFDVASEPGAPAFSKVRVSIPPDRLNLDDQRRLLVPVLSKLPVVFVDQYGAAGEDPARNRYGETYQLRRLLAPVTTRDPDNRTLIQIRHTTLDRIVRAGTGNAAPGDDNARDGIARDGIARDNGAGAGLLPGSDATGAVALEDVRLVVVAGVSQPTPDAVTLLREYVWQGGQLLIAAGAGFDSLGWSTTGFADGAGVLPLPLEAASVGQTPAESSGKLAPFFLDFRSMQNDYFMIENEDRAALESLYASPLFFKAVRADDRDETVNRLVAQEVSRLTEQQAFLQAELARSKREAQGLLTAEEAAQRQADRQRLSRMNPQWLLWSDEGLDDSLNEGRSEAASAAKARSQPGHDALGGARQAEERLPEEVAENQRPRVRARFTNGAPFLIERRIGRGRVLLVTTGVFAGADGSGWNTLPHTDAMVMFDRTLRSMINRTLPRRNYEPVEEISLPIASNMRRGRFQLTRPDGVEDLLPVDALGGDRYAVTLRNVTRRGEYVVTARRPESAANEQIDTKLWEAALAVNGPAEESQPEFLDAKTFAERVAATGANVAKKVRWVGPGEEIHLEGADRGAKLLVEDSAHRRVGVVVDGNAVRRLVGATTTYGGRMTRFLGRILGVEDLNSIESVEASLSASWRRRLLPCFGC